MRCLRSRTTVLVLLLASPAAAQKPADSPAPAGDGQKQASESGQPQGYAELLDQWQQLKKQLAEVAQEYRDERSSDKKAQILKQKYLPLADRAEKLLPTLRAAAVRQYQQTPHDDETLTQVLLSFAAADVRDDEYEQALELGELLEKNGCQEPALHYVLGMASYCLDDFERADKELRLADEADLLRDEKVLLQDLPDIKQRWAREQELRKKQAELDRLPRVRLQTSKGVMVLELYEDEAPQTVANFIHLVRKKFYDGLTFHRVLSGFMAQGGCPEGTGRGGPGYNIYCECTKEDHRHHFRGALSMAHAGRDTGGSQFFITFRPTPTLDGKHTVFGRVVEGLDVLAKIQRRDPARPGQPEPDKILRAEVIRAQDHDYLPTKVKP